jgi:hypothetical protein
MVCLIALREIRRALNKLNIDWNNEGWIRSLFPGNTLSFSSIGISSTQVSQIDYVDLEESRYHAILLCCGSVPDAAKRFM